MDKCNYTGSIINRPRTIHLRKVRSGEHIVTVRESAQEIRYSRFSDIRLGVFCIMTWACIHAKLKEWIIIFIEKSFSTTATLAHPEKSHCLLCIWGWLHFRFIFLWGKLRLTITCKGKHQLSQILNLIWHAHATLNISAWRI